MAILDVVRAIVGRRSRITRAEMRDILGQLNAVGGLDLANDCAGDTTPAGWERACRGITVISVQSDAPSYHGQIRYDEPGSMAPLQRATLMFVAEALGDYEYDQIGQMRRRADRVLIVTGEAEPTPTPARDVAINECGNGHRWPETAGEDCPTCGEGWV